jgi:hypothetical protein
MRKTAILLGATLLPFGAFAAPLGSTAVSSDGPSYNYIQGDYIADGDLRGTNKDYYGGGVEASAEIAPHVFVNGRYDRLNVQNDQTNVNRGRLGVGVADFYNYGGKPGTGVGYYGQVSYERLGLKDIRNGSADATGTGGSVDLGLRWMVDPAVEINPSVGYAKFGRISDGGTSLGKAKGMRYSLRTLGYLTDNVALSAEYAKTDYDISKANIDFDNELRFGARLTF